MDNTTSSSSCSSTHTTIVVFMDPACSDRWKAAKTSSHAKKKRGLFWCRRRWRSSSRTVATTVHDEASELARHDSLLTTGHDSFDQPECRCDCHGEEDCALNATTETTNESTNESTLVSKSHYRGQMSRVARLDNNNNDDNYALLIHEAAHASNDEHSLRLYERAYAHSARASREEAAQLCYACSRLALRLGRVERALVHLKTEARHVSPLAAAKCYAEMARLAQYTLFDAPRALGLYREAMRLLQACPKDAEDVQNQIRETKESMGRILFELGHLDEALRML